MKRVLGVCFIALLMIGFTGKSRVVKKGNEAFRNKRYQTALDQYQKAQVKSPDSSQIRYNVGNASYELSHYRDAEQAYESVLRKVGKDEVLLARSMYNYGNVQYRLGQFDKAIGAYKKVLDIDPQDADAKYNLEFLEKKKRAFEKKHADRQKQKQDREQKSPSQGQQQQQQGGGSDQKQDQPQAGGGKENESNRDQQDQTSQKDEQQESPQDSQDSRKAQGADQKPGDEDEQAPMKPGEKEGEEKKREEESKAGEEPKPLPEPSLSPYELSQLEPSRQEPPPSSQVPPPGETPSEGSGAMIREGGKISMQQAMQILNALNEAEREVLNLRRPPVKPREKTVDKDW